ncbi:hypothetical protein J7I97_25010 [Streptomyces sp. ISL-87]|uniref:hypothetical protein n=1 Tax=Streptomyces sp. ISL-87 TaxID=2819188 RepID=UPI001BE56522|nr:hypothetical protein [Streptomyces sp. ISL-87]MBT2611428.1 hypothetical protein [Streptomyces sp. ISL-87]
MTSSVFRPADVSIGLDYIEFDVRTARDGTCAPAVKAVYMALATFANVDDHTTLAPEAAAGFSEEARRALLPYRTSIAARIGRSVDTVDRGTKELVTRELLLIAPQSSADGAPDASVYHLTDREQWARRTLERAAARTEALAAGQPWPPRSSGPHVPRVYRDPGFDFIKLDAPTVARGDLSPNYKSVYAAVATFVHGKTRTSNNRPPTYKELCSCTGLGRSTVASNLSAMVDDGLLLITERYDSENGGRAASAYTLMDAKWWAQRALSRMRAAEEEHARENGLEEGVAAPAGWGWPHQVDGGGRGSRMGVAAPGGRHYKKVIRSEQEKGVADAVGQGAGGFARAGVSAGAAGESGEAGGGSAASEPHLPPQRKTSPRPAIRKTKPRQTPPGFDMVRAAVPVAVARPGTALYSGLHRAINDLLVGTEGAGIPRRSPEQVIARINRRWHGEHADVRSAADYRGCDRCTASGCKAARRSPENLEGCDRIINRSSWLAAAILQQDCPDPGCEDGVIIGGGDCTACQMRARDRREAARAAAEAEERLRADEAGREAAEASVTSWADAEAAEEFRFRMLLGRSGVFGAMLDHQVQQHMTAWRERNPAPAGEPASDSEQQLVHEEPDFDGPDEDEAPEGIPWEQLASMPSAEFRAWREQQAQAKLAALGQ